MFVPWLIELDSESLIGLDHVFPQSSDRENMILVLWLPVNRLQTMYTLPALMTWFWPNAVNVQVPAPARGMSVAIQVLSRNWPEVPASTTIVPWKGIESFPERALPFSFWLASKNVETKTAPLLVPRLNAIPL